MLEPTLKKFFMNYDEKKLEFSLLSGEVKLTNLFLNRQAVNEILANSNTPFQVKFGMVTKLHIKISIMGLYIDFIDVEDLILVVSPDPKGGAQFENKAFQNEAKSQLLMHMINNFEAMRNGTAMKPIQKYDKLPKELQEKIKLNEENHKVPFSEKGEVNVVKDKNNNTVEEAKPNFMGPELMGIITGRMNFDIKIKNIRFYYEDNSTITGRASTSSYFSFCLNISDLTITTLDVPSKCDAQGNFKDLFNLKNLMSTLSGTTELIYLNLFIQRITLEIYMGNNQILPATLDQDLNTKEPAYFVDYFQKLNSRRTGSYVDLFILDTFSTDVILGHDKADNSALPINGVILYTSLREMTINVQLSILSQITEILNYVTSIQALAKVIDMTPPIGIITKAQATEYAKELNLNQTQIIALKQIQKEIIREHFAVALWRDLFIKYSALDTIDVRRRMIFKYKQSSLIYQLIYGRTKKEISDDLAKFIKEEQEYVRKVEELAAAQAIKDSEGAPPQAAPGQPEDMRTRMNKLFGKISKQTWKFHAHARLHANFYINYLDQNFRKELSFIFRGLDVNVVKPRGRFHANIGVMLKNILLVLNTPAPPKSANRSIFESKAPALPSNPHDEYRESIRNGQGSVNTEFRTLIDSACVDYRKFRLNIDITTEEHISRCLIPILTITGESGELLLKMGVPIIKKLLEMKLAIDKQNLEQFKKASLGLKKNMDYKMAKAVKTVIKSHKGANLVKDSFLKTLDSVCSFSREKIPLNTLKRMHKKNMNISVTGSQVQKNQSQLADLDLRKSDPQLHAQLKKMYLDWVDQKNKKKEQEAKNMQLNPLQGPTDGLQKVSKILEAFVIKVNFALKKVHYAMVDDRSKVIIY